MVVGEVLDLEGEVEIQALVVEAEMLALVAEVMLASAVEVEMLASVVTWELATIAEVVRLASIEEVVRLGSAGEVEVEMLKPTRSLPAASPSATRKIYLSNQGCRHLAQEDLSLHQLHLLLSGRAATLVHLRHSHAHKS